VFGSSEDPNKRPTLRYLIHINIICTAKGHYYLCTLQAAPATSRQLVPNIPTDILALTRSRPSSHATAGVSEKKCGDTSTFPVVLGITQTTTTAAIIDQPSLNPQVAVPAVENVRSRKRACGRLCCLEAKPFILISPRRHQQLTELAFPSNRTSSAGQRNCIFLQIGSCRECEKQCGIQDPESLACKSIRSLLGSAEVKRPKRNHNGRVRSKHNPRDSTARQNLHSRRGRNWVFLFGCCLEC
jgi:hypothetical protein